MMSDDRLETLVRQLLTPLSGTDPAGRWMRYERAFTDIARQREEDNPHLPMGEWERPLVKADWRKIAAGCTQMLNDDSKDFQVAAWLCDAWIRTSSLDGLCAGLDLIVGIAENFWNTAWPALDEDDTDRRIAPFVWMNTNLPLTLRLTTILLLPVMQRETPITLLDWESAPGADEAKHRDTERPNRQELRVSVKAADADRLRHIAERAIYAAATLDKLSHFLDAQLKADSPSLKKLSNVIDSTQQAAQSLLQTFDASVVALVNATAPSAARTDELSTIKSAENSVINDASVELATVASSIGNRKQAYAALASIAAYLQTVEPHSPTPYLIQRAVELGQLSLPDMVREVSASAGSLDRFFELLGIRPPE